jgi:hypothetical protein
MCLLACGHYPCTCENKIFKIFVGVESKTIHMWSFYVLRLFLCAFFFFSLFYVPFLFLLWSVPLFFFFIFHFFFWLNVLRDIYSNIKVNFGVSIFFII